MPEDLPGVRAEVTFTRVALWRSPADRGRHGLPGIHPAGPTVASSAESSG